MKCGLRIFSRQARGVHGLGARRVQRAQALLQARRGKIEEGAQFPRQQWLRWVHQTDGPGFRLELFEDELEIARRYRRGRLIGKQALEERDERIAALEAEVLRLRARPTG